MSTGRDAVTMSAGELAEFLSSNMKVQVATNSSDGFPHLSTLFYALNDDGQITFWTYAKSQKIVNLERDPRVSVLVEDGEDYFELRGASMRGHARLVTAYDDILAIGSKVAQVMSGVDSVDALGEMGKDIVEKQARKRVAVVIDVDHIATWDHRKMV